MALHISATRITSDLAGCGSNADLIGGSWRATGHPGRRFTRDQAITAMLLAEVYTLNPPPDARIWLHVAGWRRELGVSGPDTSSGGAPCRS